MPSALEVQQLLTAPGAAFELVDELVRGVAMPVYKHRMPSLRSVAALGLARGTETCLVFGDRRISFAGCVEAANSVSYHLMSDAGVTSGDRVAVLSANNPEWVYTFWGTVDLGAVLVGLNGWWKGNEVAYGLADSGARLLVADRDRFRRVADRLDTLPDLERVYLVDADPEEFGADPRLRRFDELLAAPTQAMPETEIGEDDPAVIFYTSGTTGRSKGAISTHRSMIANLQNTFYHHVAGSMIRGDNGLVGRGGGRSAALLTSPLFHVSGCHSGIVIAMAAGVTNVMTVGKFDPVAAMRLIADEQVTIWATVPTMVARVVEHPGRHDYDLSSVTTVACGGSPIGPRLQHRIRETFPNVIVVGNAYGLTESSAVATVISGADLVERPNSVGRPVPGMQVRIVTGAGTDALGGEVGEVWLRGALITPGYWGKPDETASALTPDGWLRTGDIGFVDDDGFLSITDRVKDVIIRGGENVYSVEIEDRLLEHTAVADAAVIGVPHPILGEEVRAVVSVVPGTAATSVTEGELRAWVGQTLADFKVPAYVEITVDPLPRNATGKLLKNLLRGYGPERFAETF
ncbi:MAG: acyl--CoA ligase [Actinomycetota bacterium]|nr:acyl--CoA ligase [Actinomycetota bacterium]